MKLQFSADELCGVDEDNSGAEAAHAIARAVEGGAHTARTAYRQHRAKPCRTAVRTGRRSGQATTSTHHARPQKRAIKREYAQAKRAGYSAANATQTFEKSAGIATRVARRGRRFIARHPKGLVLALVLLLAGTLFFSMLSSCSVFLQSGVASIGISTYPSTDADMLAAEAAYCAIEDELQDYLDNYETTHSYDEYNYDLDEIGHDPYVLLSILTALQQGAWTIDEVQDVLQSLFDQQYTLTEEVTTEVRGESSYTICTVTLENFNLSHLPVYLMDEEQLSMYAIYMATLGNRPDLFPDSEYVGKYGGESGTDYEIPSEALEDEQFAAMIQEAEKYLGYPYVWGGSSPSTSFDCSGFVSWVLNHCGVGWNVGRLGANGLLNICTRVSAAEAKPGDLIFFQGTYDTAGASHVGIYVGNGMMLHCGDPIQYTSIETNYWQSHFLAFGRLPSP